MSSSARSDEGGMGVGLLGLGVVGTAVAKAIVERHRSEDPSVPLNVVAAVVRDTSRKRDVDLDPSVISTNLDTVVANPDVDIVVELMGGVDPAFDYITKALEAGQHVVTANKEVMAKRGSELLATAAENNVHLFYEASVAGGIPIIGPLMNDLTANKIQSLRGIINGTTNFILTKMAHEGADFDDVLSEAQSLGYAEADPTADVDGFDALYKISVLARLAYHTEVPVDVIHREGIREVHAKDFRYASELGYTIKLLAVAQANGESGLLSRVHPALIPLDVPMASVNGVLNAVEVEGDLVGPLWFQGPGAGPNPTASAVMGDVIRIAKGAPSNGSSSSAPKPFPIASMDDHVCQYYIRLTASDRPGVLANVARVLGDADISINSVLQKDTDIENGHADLVIMTHPARESNMQSAVSSIKELDSVLRLDSLLRVETYGDRA
ncbi:homoserine dehydrogenase [Candidatus Lucifugimonas marina]|uniref:Homoserine dehydrogenase n=1 Tax=Candidatus Lucifugimonas marina TaxID=3038979 RepID=A0AAJ5ZHK6_9CHLR|nr:homoserine dehydrogenase [SAR202 cluster bacterium JH702]MDG0870262.1 homoserine dehydrogenase [SAR202 cluster bacterium JH639]WFG36175.1 homoserine dehydrogenase [SAR202 cluster bacterium JH545]WFG40121.1 homoserine dehydrogenase [SAR202 cluster bacterium JH1073]